MWLRKQSHSYQAKKKQKKKNRSYCRRNSQEDVIVAWNDVLIASGDTVYTLRLHMCVVYIVST